VSLIALSFCGWLDFGVSIAKGKAAAARRGGRGTSASSAPRTAGKNRGGGADQLAGRRLAGPAPDRPSPHRPVRRRALAEGV